ncbi:MAG: fibronectin type III domain-containing protein [Planctomycetota bacterium]|nr:fibronectin type III domain-containing protein [Planctomycetota bacterium]
MKEEHLETTAAPREPIKEVLLRKLDLMAALLGVVVLALSISGLLFGPPDDLDEQVTALTAVVEEARQHLGDTRFSRTAHEIRVQEVIEDVRSTWGKVGADKPKVGSAVAWPAILVTQQRDVESNEIVFPAPQDPRVEARFGANRVEWTTHEDNNVPVSGFRIMRKVGGGALAELKTVGADVFEYDDTDVRPGKQYTYRVLAVTEEPTVVDQRAESEPSAPATTTAVADFKVTLDDVDLAAKTATFKVEKWHGGIWHEKRFTQKIGEVIGRNDAGSGVNYTSGRVMKTLDSEQATEDRERLEVVFDGAGKVLIADGSPVTTKVVVTETFERVKVLLEGGDLPPQTLTYEKR